MTEEQSGYNEIDLIDLLCYCFEKWRFIVATTLILAIVLGGYKYRTVVNDNQSKQQQLHILETEKAEEEAINNEIAQNTEVKNDKETKKIDYLSLKSYKNVIEENERIIQRQEDYLNHTIIMQLDPYCISTGTLSCYLGGGEHIDTLLSAYQAYIADGRIAKELHSVNPEISVEDLGYLISFKNSANKVYDLGNNQVIQTIKPGEAVFQIKIKMPNSDLCDSYLRQAENAIKEYSNRLQTEIASHDLTVLSSTQAEITDLDIEEYQSTLQSTHMAAVRNLQALKSEFDILLLAENEEETAEEGKEEVGNVNEDIMEGIQIVFEDPVSSSAKAAVFGLLLGIFVSCFIMTLCYMMGGKLQNTKNFKEVYGIPVLGLIYVLETKRKIFGFIDRWVYRLRTGVYSKIEFDEQIKIAIANVQTAIDGISTQKNIKKIMIAGTIPEKDAELLCVRLASQTKGGVLSAYKQIAFYSAAIQTLDDYDAVLFLEKRGKSYSELIKQEKQLVLDRNVSILGAIVLS